MSDQSNETNNQPEPANGWETHQQRRQERRAARGSRTNGSWIGGIILILIGVGFLLQTQGFYYLQNWWALFILIPALGAFGNAWRAYQDAGGYLNAQARGSLIMGVLFSMVTATFLFNLNWSLLGPMLIILAGIGILLNAVLPGEPK